MATTFNTYLDSGLLTLASNINFTQNIDGSTGAQDIQLWFGSATASRRARALSNPGTDQITMQVVDSAPGTGLPATDVKLALSQGALAAATGGAGLDLGTVVLSGSANAVSFWMRYEDSTHAVAASAELSIIPVDLEESVV